ncbi:hypothetical protein ASE69_02520 [Sphingomonas sp. Leaf208]|jgi:hypothetical protein|uniref:hypothetical protein n=1 Tax=Sphingomonas sp. Leaf208 TaxID=1735679 RepID=UPI0006F9E4E5|nr:hypothetical protein [Sphingomonas sp. Leaf208]KQM56537.1 hypothetical protein ASE69_02520 [Sphingomonas sp. Leaf208]
MPPEAALILGIIVGTLATLTIQAFGRRKARIAVKAANRDAERSIALLDSENERRTGQIDRLQERIQVLERITTDPAERTAREIEALRLQPN